MKFPGGRYGRAARRMPLSRFETAIVEREGEGICKLARKLDH
jgi:hypothetical protein